MPEVLNKKETDPARVEKECEEIESELAELRAAYEQYFLGLDKIPTTRHQKLKKRVATLKQTYVQSTALKFRIQSQHSRYLTYERLWQKTIQEMEDGVYRRDLFKARFRAKHREEAKAKEPEREALPPAPPAPPVAAAPQAGKAAPAKASPTAAAAPPPPARAPGGSILSDEQVKLLFNAYVKAKKQCNEDTSKLSLEGVAASLRKQVPELIKKHNARGVEFKVVIKDGKALLKAVPKT